MQDIQHDRREVKQLVSRLLTLTRLTVPPATSALAPIRWELMRRLFTLLTLEQVMGSNRRDTARDLLTRWKAHSLTWTTQRIDSDWNGYVLDAGTMLQEISAFCDSRG